MQYMQYISMSLHSEMQYIYTCMYWVDMTDFWMT